MRNRKGRQDTETVVNVNAGGEEGWLPLLMQQHPLVLVVALMAITLGSSILGSWSLYYWTQEDAKSARIDHYRVTSELPDLEKEVKENREAIVRLENRMASVESNIEGLHAKIEDWRVKEQDDMRYLQQRMDEFKKLFLEVLVEMKMKE